MSSPGSVTLWLASFKTGDPEAVRELFRRYYRRARGLAQQVLRAPAVQDLADDAANDAFHHLFRAATSGNLPRLDDREDLWRILSEITRRRAVDLVRRAARGPGCTGTETLVDIPLTALGPDHVSLCRDMIAELLDRLPDEEHRLVAQLRMEGYTVEEIGRECGLSRSAVYDRLEVIWKVAELLNA